MSAHLDGLFEGYPKRMSPQDVADVLGLTNQGVYKLIRSKAIPAYKLGGSWMILRDELRDAIAAGSNLGESASHDDHDSEDE